MTSTFWYNIAVTPWWVYAINIYLLRIGWMVRKGKPVPYRNLRLVTIVFLIATIGALVYTKQFDYPQIGTWLAAIAAGSVLGWAQYRIMRIKAIRYESQIYLPGNWLFMLCVAAVIYSQFHFGYGQFIDLIYLNNQALTKWLPLAYGLFGGLFIGRLIYSRRALLDGPFVETNALMCNGTHSANTSRL